MAERSNFPLFAPMNVEDSTSETYDYLMCLWRLKNEDKFCAETCGDFYQMISHLKEEHNLDLKNTIDYCLPCEYIFQSRLDAIQHYLAKTLSTQSFEMTFENGSEEAEAMKEWLKPIYLRLNADYKVIMYRVLFSEEMPALGEEAEDFELPETQEMPEQAYETDHYEFPDTQEIPTYGYDAVDEADGPGDH